MKKGLKYLFFCLVILLIPRNGSCQYKSFDSLKIALKKAKYDTARCLILQEILQNTPDGVWEPYNLQLKNIAEYNLRTCSPSDPDYVFYKKQLAASTSNLGYISVNEGNPTLALEHFLTSLKIQQEIKDEAGTSLTMTNIAFIYKSQGNISKALEWELNSLKIKEKVGDIIGTAYSLNNIAVIYKNQGLRPKALEYYNKSMSNFEKGGDKEGIALILNNIGIFYKDEKDISKAMSYLKKSLALRQSIYDRKGEANALNNIAGLYSYDSTQKAIGYYEKAIKLYEELGDKDGLAFSLNGISETYLKNHEIAMAQKNASKALALAQEVGYPENIRNSAKILSEIYDIQHNYERSLEMYELYINMRDSINNQETRKSTMRSQLKYEYDKKAAADSVKAAEEKKITGAKLKHEQKQRYILYSGLSLTLIFCCFMFYLFRITRRQKNIIEEQKNTVEDQKRLVEEKQKEVLDSIRYAKRIQQSLLPSEKYIHRNLNQKTL